MRHEMFVVAMALALLAGCATRDRVVEVDDGTSLPAPRAKAKVGELSHGGKINLGLAQNYLQAGELRTALDRANRALESDPGSGRSNVATTWARRNSWSSPISAMRSAISPPVG